MKITDMKPGLKVVTVEEIDMFPLAVLPIGLTGTVTAIDLFLGNPTTACVKIDQPVGDLGEWDNELYVFAEDDTTSPVVASAFEPRPA